MSTDTITKRLKILSDLHDELNKIKAKNDAELAQLPAKEQGFVRVMRDATVAQDIYVMLAKRLEEAKVAEVMVANDVADFCEGKEGKLC